MIEVFLFALLVTPLVLVVLIELLNRTEDH